MNGFFVFQAEIEAHVRPGYLSLHVHYGQTRSKDARVLAQNDVVITTYGVLASEFSAEVVANFILIYKSVILDSHLLSCVFIYFCICL